MGCKFSPLFERFSTFCFAFEAEGLQCTECYSFVSFEDCDSNKKEPERCPEGSQRCYTYMTEDKDVNGGDIQKFFEKGCTQYADQECNSEKPCQEFPGFLHILSEGRREMEKCSYKCCRQDNCNASSSHESGSGNGEDINEEI